MYIIHICTYIRIKNYITYVRTSIFVYIFVCFINIWTQIDTYMDTSYYVYIQLQASRCIGKHENIVASIENAQQNGHKKYADQDVERKAASEIIMEQIRAYRQLTTFLEDMPLSPLGLRKKTKAEGMGTPFTLWFSFNAFVSYIKTPRRTNIRITAARHGIRS